MLAERAGFQSQPLTGRQRGGSFFGEYELAVSCSSVLRVTNRGAGYQFAVIAGSEIGWRVIGFEVWIVDFYMSGDFLYRRTVRFSGHRKCLQCTNLYGTIHFDLKTFAVDDERWNHHLGNGTLD
jgi:hypothetical protein